MVGTILGLVAAFSYGVTIICNRELATRGFGPAASLSVRFAVAGAASIVLLRVLGRPLLPAPGERWRALGLGMVGYAAQSILFYSAVQRGSAAAVALLFYSYPTIVAALELARRRVSWSAELGVALALSAGGTVLIVTAGSDVTITRTGVAFALGAAACFAVYMLAAAGATPRTDSLTNAAWVAIGATLAITTFGLATGGLRDPGASWWVMALNGLATASAFAFLFAAVRRLGASRTSIVMTMEAFSAVVLAALLLDERIGLRQAAGGMAIVAAAVVISSRRR